MCLLACEAGQGDSRLALPAAGAVELIHNFSLVHDDIQDVSQYRRGRRAVWDIWGAAHGINVGDGLFVLARLALHRLVDRGVSLERVQAATLAFDRACMSLCEGQFFDMTFEERLEVDQDQYLWMIRNKTAALLATAMEMGAIVATDDRHVIDHLRGFGEHLGMAFQIQDDILGAWGDEALTGKSAATDIRDKKKTLPVVYVLGHPDERGSARRLGELFSRKGPLDGESIQEALSLLERAGAQEFSESMAEAYYRRALASLEQTGIENSAQANLRDLAASLMNRDT
jgi:geranylgeranyl diphosphate synthase type I